MPELFISYKRENQPFAETLRENLLAWGHSVWMDVYDIPPGAHWPDAIDAGITSAHTVIGVLSPDAVQSRNVKNEWDWAIVNGRRLLLIMLEACTVPVNYVSIHYIDATADHAAALARLRTVLEAPTDPPAARDDPYLPYLQALYERINTVLASAIIKLDDRREPEPIPLISRRTDGVVTALFEKRDEIDPLLTVRGLATDQPEWEAGDFRAAFDHFDGRVLLLGEPGAGKTITLLHFGRDAVVQRSQDRTKPLPMLALIPTWDASVQPPIIDWIAESYGVPENARQMIEQGRALLLLDGLDELSSEREEQDPDHPDDPERKIRYDPRQRFIATLAKLPTNQIIVTCRVKDYESIDAKIALNSAVTLQPLSDGQMRAYLDTLPDLWAALQSDEGLREIARTPLLLSFFAFAYRDMSDEDATQLRDLTESPGDLRDAIFERYVCERYAHEARRLAQIGEEMPFSLDEIYAVLGKVAMWNARRYWGEENVLRREDFADALEHIDRQNRVPDFLVLALHLNLIAQGENDTWRFIHLLLRDYFGFNYALPLLSSAASRMRQGVAVVLGHLGDARAVESLITALCDDDSGVRGNAIDALGRIGDARAVESLITALRDDSWYVRQHVVLALGRIGDARAVEPLSAVLRDDDRDVRRAAADALGQIGDGHAVEPLSAVLRDDDRDVRSAAVGALAKIGTPAVDVLAAALRDSWDTRRSVAEALVKTGVSAIDALVAALRDDERDVRRAAADALVEIGAPAVDALTTILRNGNWFVRSSATEALAKIGAPAVDALIAVLGDDDSDVRRCAAEALGQIGDARAVEPLIAALRDDDRGVRRSAAETLVKIGAPAVGALITALFGDNEYVCRSAFDALTRIGTPEVLAAVEAWRAAQESGDA